MRRLFLFIAIFVMVATQMEASIRVFMRHGEQAKDSGLEALSPEEQKIEMMRLPRKQGRWINFCL